MEKTAQPIDPSLPPHPGPLPFGEREKIKRHVRPWALAAPIAVLLIALPLLRPLRHPLDVSRQEGDRLRAIAMHVDQGRLWPSPARANDPAEMHETHPVFALMLSGPYWLMHR